MRSTTPPKAEPIGENRVPASPPARQGYRLKRSADVRTSLRPFSFGALSIGIAGLFVLSLAIGSVPIPVEQIIRALFGMELANPSWGAIVWELRMPRAITALSAGAALGAAGLLLQTLFKNPLADAWVLGLIGGAQLGVAIVVTAGAIVGSATLARLGFLNDIGMVAGGMLGAGVVALLVAAMSRHVTTMTLLILGLMLGFLAEGLVSVVLHFTTEVQARIFASWNDGSFGGVTWNQIPILLPMLGFGLVFAFVMVKPLNALLLGERYASSLGLPVNHVRLAVLACAVLLAGPVTAFCGPVLFLGIIVPHMARGLFNTSDHRILMPASALLGAVFALAADLIVHLPWDRHVLHLNAVNAVIGAPIVIAILLRNRNIRSMEL